MSEEKADSGFERKVTKHRKHTSHQHETKHHTHKAEVSNDMEQGERGYVNVELKHRKRHHHKHRKHKRSHSSSDKGGSSKELVTDSLFHPTNNMDDEENQMKMDMDDMQPRWPRKKHAHEHQEPSMPRNKLDDVEAAIQASLVSMNQDGMQLDSPPSQIEEQQRLGTNRQPREPQQEIRPGAVAVRGPGADSTMGGDDEYTVTQRESQREYSDHLLSAVLVDPEADRCTLQQQVDNQVQERLECEVQARLKQELKERDRAVPTAEPVSNYWCTPRVQWLGIFVILGLMAIVLGTVLSQVLGSELDTSSLSADLRAKLPASSFDPGTPQNNALLWLISNSSSLESYGEEKQAQRFALATLYYSTNGDNWNDSKHWLTL